MLPVGVAYKFLQQYFMKGKVDGAVKAETRITMTTETSLLLLTEFITPTYHLAFDTVDYSCKIYARPSNQLLFGFAIDAAVDTLSQQDETRHIRLAAWSQTEQTTRVVFEVKSTLWPKKEVIFELQAECIAMHITVAGQGQRINTVNYLVNRRGKVNATDFGQVYVPRFDWLQSQVIIDSRATDSLSCQQWLSPPPFVYAFFNAQESVFCGLAAKPGAYNFLSFDYTGGPSFALTYEGHTVVEGEFQSPKLVIGFGATEKNQSINRYIQWLRANGYLAQEGAKTIPNWWRQPIFCGWGQMRYDYRRDHDDHENGNFVNVTDYCTEYLYRGYVETLEQNGINPGTIIIDMGWAKQPARHTPDPQKWPDLRGFIDREHQKGRRVLLWYSPVITAGLPPEACMTLAGRAVCPDPTSLVYREILAEEIRRMISPEADCLNADGFKIDFTQNTPAENGRFIGYINSFWGLINESNPKHLYPPLREREELIKTAGSKWGVEILKAYISQIYTNMKKAKSDSMLITHTANPYFQRWWMYCGSMTWMGNVKMCWGNAKSGGGCRDVQPKLAA
jgi:hypothetical protein